MSKHLPRKFYLFAVETDLAAIRVSYVLGTSFDICSCFRLKTICGMQCTTSELASRVSEKLCGFICFELQNFLLSYCN